MGIGKQLIKVRELFWPVLEPLESRIVKTIKDDDYSFNDSDLDLELKYIENYKNSEESRKKEIESKAIIFIGTFAVANTVLISLAKEFIFSENLVYVPMSSVVVVLISLTIIYLCRSILFSIQALKRRCYSTLGYPNFMLEDIGDKVKKQKLLVIQYNCVKRNQEVINLKVDYMTMAQEFFFRAVVTVICLVGVFLGSFFLMSRGIWKKLNYVVQHVTIDEGMIICIFSIIIVLIITILVLFSRVKRMEKKINDCEKN